MPSGTWQDPSEPCLSTLFNLSTQGGILTQEWQGQFYVSKSHAIKSGAGFKTKTS